MTSLAVLFGVIGTAVGFPIADPIVGLLITIAIRLVLKQAVGQVLHRILDGVEPGLIDRIERQVRAVPGVVDITDCKARWSGHGLLAEVTISVDPNLNVVAANAISDQVESSLRHAIKRLRTATVRVEPVKQNATAIAASGISASAV